MFGSRRIKDLEDRVGQLQAEKDLLHGLILQLRQDLAGAHEASLKERRELLNRFDEERRELMNALGSNKPAAFESLKDDVSDEELAGMQDKQKAFAARFNHWHGEGLREMRRG